MRAELGRGHRVRSLLKLAVSMARRRIQVDRFQIAEEMGVSPRTALRYLQALEEVGLVEKIGDPRETQKQFWRASADLRDLIPSDGVRRALDPSRTASA